MRFVKDSANLFLSDITASVEIVSMVITVIIVDIFGSRLRILF